jgi:putative transposase
VQTLQVGFQVSERRACAVVGMQRSTYRYRSSAKDQTALRMRLRDLAAARVRYGYRRLHVLLQREGWRVNHKRVYRLYRLEGLGLRLKRTRKRVSAVRVVPPRAQKPNERWSMDFMTDSLYDGRRFRLLTIVGSWRRWNSSKRHAGCPNASPSIMAQSLSRKRWMRGHTARGAVGVQSPGDAHG